MILVELLADTVGRGAYARKGFVHRRRLTHVEYRPGKTQDFLALPREFQLLHRSALENRREVWCGQRANGGLVIKANDTGVAPHWGGIMDLTLKRVNTRQTSTALLLPPRWPWRKAEEVWVVLAPRNLDESPRYYYLHVVPVGEGPIGERWGFKFVEAFSHGRRELPDPTERFERMLAEGELPVPEAQELPDDVDVG